MDTKNAVLIAVLIACAGTTFGQSVRINTYQGSNSTPTSSTTVSSGANITINVDDQISRICVFTDGGGSSANIGAISVNHAGGTSRSGELQFILMDRPASLSFPAFDTNLSPVATNLGGIVFDSGTASWATVSGSISGNLIGAVSANRIVRFEVGGVADGPISAAPTFGTAIEFLQVGATTSVGTITAGDTTTGGDVFAIEVGTGALAGAVLVGGKLENLICAGDIDIAANPGIYARDGLDTIQAGDITAHIETSTSGGAAINRIECGNFTGSLTTDRLVTMGSQTPNDPDDLGIKVMGDLDGVLSFSGDVNRAIHVTGAFLEGSAVHVGGTLSASVTANGYVTEISVDGAVSLSSTGVGPITLGSLSDDVGSISSVLGFQRDDNRAGPEVIFTAAQRIGSIVGGPPGGVNTDVINGLLAAPEVGTILARGVMRLDFYLENFERIEVWDDFEWDSTSIEDVQLGGSGLFVIGGTCGAELRFGPSDDFTGQVIVNAWNESASWTYPAAFWDPVLAEFVETDPYPYYENFGTEEVMPGGAIGLVPFHLHRTLCEPPHAPDGTCEYTLPTRVWPSSHGGGTRETIVIRHYRPVFDGEDGSESDDAATNPLVIERRSVVLCYPTPCEGEEP